MYGDKVNGDDIQAQIGDINVLSYVYEAAQDYRHAIEIRLLLIRFFEEDKDEGLLPYSYDEAIGSGYKAVSELYRKLGDEKAAMTYLRLAASAFPQRYAHIDEKEPERT